MSAGAIRTMFNGLMAAFVPEADVGAPTESTTLYTRTKEKDSLRVSVICATRGALAHREVKLTGFSHLTLSIR